MATWREFEREAPEMAQEVRTRFAREQQALIATLRKDGSPRICGVDPDVVDGELRMGMMTGSLKSRDLQRDPRFSLHNSTSAAEMTKGDARVSGRAYLYEQTDGADMFRADITEAVTVTVEGDELVIVSWHEGKGLSRAVRT